MAALEALVGDKMKLAAEEKSQKQTNRIRLIADPSITATALQSVLTSFLNYKGHKNLWLVVAPPPSGPTSYGWHTSPQGEWMVKASGLIYDLLNIAPNTKIQSTRLIKALKTMYESKDLDLETSTTRSVQDCLDRLDFTIRVLMSQVRQLKESPSLKTKMFRNMSKKEQVGLDLILGKTTLPAELLQGDLLEEEDTLNRTISMDPLPEECLSLVPWQASKPSEATGKPKSGKKGGFLEGFVFPKIFGKILGEEQEPQDKNPHPEPPKNEATKTVQLPASQALKSTSTAASSVSKALAEAMEYTPNITQSQKSQKSQKKPKKENPTKKKKNTGKKSKASQVIQEKKKKTQKKNKSSEATLEKKSLPAAQPAQEVVQEETKYEPGEYMKCCKTFIQDFLDQAAASGEEATYAMARDKWSTSMKRAMLLSTVSLPELKRRRFVSKDCTSNPFAAMVNQVQDID